MHGKAVFEEARQQHRCINIIDGQKMLAMWHPKGIRKQQQPDRRNTYLKPVFSKNGM